MSHAVIEKPAQHNGRQVTRSFVRVDRTFRAANTGKPADLLAADATYYFKGVHEFSAEELAAYCVSVQDGTEVVTELP